MYVYVVCMYIHIGLENNATSIPPSFSPRKKDSLCASRYCRAMVGRGQLTGFNLPQGRVEGSLFTPNPPPLHPTFFLIFPLHKSTMYYI